MLPQERPARQAFSERASFGYRRRENVLETVKQFGVNYDKTWIYDKMYFAPPNPRRALSASRSDRRVLVHCALCVAATTRSTSSAPSTT